MRERARGGVGSDGGDGVEHVQRVVVRARQVVERDGGVRGDGVVRWAGVREGSGDAGEG